MARDDNDHDDEPPAIDDRKALILRAIVEEYVGTGQPVGSKRIAESRDLGVSAATVRNEMSVLEEEGFIDHPHTSAGRVPTDRGYRYFVDRYVRPVDGSDLSAHQQREVAAFFSSTARAMEDLLGETSQLLARLTDHAAVVLGPGPEVETVRSVQLVELQPGTILAVVVLSDGAVEKEAFTAPDDLGPDAIAAASARLDDRWRGMTLAGATARWPAAAGGDAPRDPADELVARATEVLASRREAVTGDPLFVGGASRLAAEQEAFHSTTVTARVLELLEEGVVVVSLLRELLGPGLTITIGSEHSETDLRECSLVLAPYLVEGEPAGTVGILGPTRMDYRRAGAAVDAVSRRLGRQLSR